MATAPLVVLLYDRTFLSGSFRKALRRPLGALSRSGGDLGNVVWMLAATDFHGDTTGFQIGSSLGGRIC